MKVAYENGFIRDLKKLHDKVLLKRIDEAIVRVKESADLTGLGEIEKLSGYEQHYRIRVGRYRLGVVVVNDTVEFVRCLHRRDIYRLFPR